MVSCWVPALFILLTLSLLPPHSSSPFSSGPLTLWAWEAVADAFSNPRTFPGPFSSHGRPDAVLFLFYFPAPLLPRTPHPGLLRPMAPPPPAPFFLSAASRSFPSPPGSSPDRLRASLQLPRSHSLAADRELGPWPLTQSRALPTPLSVECFRDRRSERSQEEGDAGDREAEMRRLGGRRGPGGKGQASGILGDDG